MNERLRHLRAMGCEVNIYGDDSGWRVEIASGRTGRNDSNANEPTYWTVNVDERPTREQAEDDVLARFDELGFFPTPETSFPMEEPVR